jgi:hypothetical protein
MSDVIPVVRVKTANGPLEINKSDYDADPSKWELAEPEAAPPPPAPVVPAPNAASAPPPPPATVPPVDPGTVAPPPPPAPNGDTGSAPPPPPALKSDTANAERLVAKIGKKFYIVDNKGEKLSVQSFDTEADARAATI